MLRLAVAPSLTFEVLSTRPFSEIIPRGLEGCILVRTEGVKNTLTHEIESSLGIEWVVRYWETAIRLFEESAEYRLALSALDDAHFVKDSALALVSFWGAFEALFSHDRSELRFRVSTLLASYLEPPGPNRQALQRSIAKLYDLRSAIVHGRPKLSHDDFRQTFLLLRRVVLKITEAGAVPTRESLEATLFGAIDWA